MALKKNATNIELVTHMMKFSNYGALSQLFIMDAIDKWSAKIANTPLKDLRAAFGQNAFVNPDAWHAVAKEIQQRLKERD